MTDELVGQSEIHVSTSTKKKKFPFQNISKFSSKTTCTSQQLVLQGDYNLRLY